MDRPGRAWDRSRASSVCDDNVVQDLVSADRRLL